MATDTPLTGRNSASEVDEEVLLDDDTVNSVRAARNMYLCLLFVFSVLLIALQSTPLLFLVDILLVLFAFIEFQHNQTKLKKGSQLRELPTRIGKLNTRLQHFGLRGLDVQEATAESFIEDREVKSLWKLNARVASIEPRLDDIEAAMDVCAEHGFRAEKRELDKTVHNLDTDGLDDVIQTIEGRRIYEEQKDTIRDLRDTPLSNLVNRVERLAVSGSYEEIPAVIDRIKTRLDAMWTLDRILQDYSPTEFEELVADLYSAKGYSTRVTDRSGDDGIDVVAKKDGQVVAIQAKRNSPDNKVGSPVIRKTFGGGSQIGADEIVVVTTSEYSSPAMDAAEELSETTPTTLIDGDELVTRLTRANVVPKGTSTRY